LSKQTITIVGAGLVGSLLACHLGKRGYTVNVYEKRPDLRKRKLIAGRSINLALSTRGWRALEGVGIGEDVRREGIPMRGRMMHDTKGELSFQPYGVGEQAIWSISRGGLNQLLMNKAEQDNDVTFHFNMKCMNVDVDNASATFVDYATKEEHNVTSDVVIGAETILTPTIRSCTSQHSMAIFRSKKRLCIFGREVSLC